uniref:U7-agatoxin-Ao1a n=1 Tax=Agelena orientalis TaxID=293813 RepID=TXAG7_AGEOR|nr:RecName: Full=U7-agatoxin-Ao1a; Short=U7-AGTX-Ao1a; AltName: Full=AgorTX_A5; Flags: Precursor [Agelena orientalis]AAU93681.1 toxin-like structure AgorTX_A5 precursor [Agelena orientalis]
MTQAFFFLLLVSLVASTLSKEFNFCPRAIDEVCPVKEKRNECCSSKECRFGEMCCSEPCGNVCRVKSDTPLGFPAKEDSNCKVGEIKKKWYQKVWSKITKWG